MKLTQTESILYRDHRITLNANLHTGEFIAVCTVHGQVMTSRDLSANLTVEKIKKKIDEALNEI